MFQVASTYDGSGRVPAAMYVCFMLITDTQAHRHRHRRTSKNAIFLKQGLQDA